MALSPTPLAWPAPGARATWQVALRAGERHPVGGTVVSGKLALRGTLAVRGVSPAEGRARTAWSLVSVDDAELVLLGEPVRAALAGELRHREVLVTHGDAGQALALEVPVDLPAHVVALLRALVFEAQVALPQGDGAVVERTPRGLAHSRYATVDEHTLTRTRERYADAPFAGEATLEGVATLSFDALGLAALRSDETVAGPHGDVAFAALTLTRVDSGAASPLPPLDLVALAEPALGPRGADGAARADHAALRAQAGDLSGERLLEEMRFFGRLGRLPDENRFVWQAAARLRLEPALCAALAEEVPAFSPEGRGLAFDLLTAAGSPAAQAALLQALRALPVDDGRAALVTRLAFLEAPEPDVLAFLVDEARGDDTSARTALHALGSTIGAAVRSGSAAWRAGHAVLVERLHDAQSRDQRALALAALGNAGLAEDDARVARHASDADPRVRAQVAVALRKIDTPLAHDTLFSLVSDGSADVQARALNALGARPLDGTDLQALAARAKNVHADAAASFIDLASSWLQDPELAADARAALQALLDARPDHPDINARLHLLLGSG